MRFRIHFERPDGTEDFLDLNGDSLEEIRTQADEEIGKRHGTNPWSEEIKP